MTPTCKRQPRMTRRKWICVFTKNLFAWLEISPAPHLKPTLLLTKSKNKPLSRVLWLLQVARISIYLPTTTDVWLRNGPLSPHMRLDHGDLIHMRSWGGYETSQGVDNCLEVPQLKFLSMFCYNKLFLLFLSWFALASFGVSSSVVICTCFFKPKKTYKGEKEVIFFYSTVPGLPTPGWSASRCPQGE